MLGPLRSRLAPSLRAGLTAGVDSGTSFRLSGLSQGKPMSTMSSAITDTGHRRYVPKSERLVIKSPVKKASSLLADLQKELAESKPIVKQWDFKIGDAIEVTWLNTMADKKPATFRGVVLGRKNKGNESGVLIRNHYAGVSLERYLKLYSPQLLDIKVLKTAAIHEKNPKKKRGKRVRRAKVYYIRNCPPSWSTVG